MSELVDTHRGCEIYYVEYQATRGQPPYMTPCLSGQWFLTLQAARNAIDILLEPEPEPEPVDYIAETYRGVEIWWKVSLQAYWAQVATGYVAVWPTLPEMRTSIDEILEFLEPPEEPPDGLFAQVVAAVKVWILENIQPWLQKWGQVVENFITNVTEYVTNVANYFTENITNVVNQISEYVTNVYNTTREYITNSYTYVTESITNNFSEVNQYITNIIGVSEESVNTKITGVTEWVVGLFAVLDPQGLLKDPHGFIKGVFETIISPWGEGIVGSFGLGFAEGLGEVVPPPPPPPPPIEWESILTQNWGAYNSWDSMETFNWGPNPEGRMVLFGSDFAGGKELGIIKTALKRRMRDEKLLLRFKVATGNIVDQGFLRLTMVARLDRTTTPDNATALYSEFDFYTGENTQTAPGPRFKFDVVGQQTPGAGYDAFELDLTEALVRHWGQTIYDSWILTYIAPTIELRNASAYMGIEYLDLLRAIEGSV